MLCQSSRIDKTTATLASKVHLWASAEAGGTPETLPLLDWHQIPPNLVTAGWKGFGSCQYCPLLQAVELTDESEAWSQGYRAFFT